MAQASPQIIEDILAKARCDAQRDDELSRSCRTIGDLLSGRIKARKEYHDRVRANILSQATGRNPDGYTPPPPAATNATHEDNFYNCLRTSGPPGKDLSSVAKRPNDMYSTPLYVKQIAPMQPAVACLVEVVKALENLNEEARSETKKLLVELDDAKFSGETERLNPEYVGASAVGAAPTAQMVQEEVRRGSVGGGKGESSSDKSRDPRLLARRG